MIRRIVYALFVAAGIAVIGDIQEAQAQQAYGKAWGGTYTGQDWNRFYHYPYVYYPQNFWGSEYYRSADSMYYRYPPEMRIPVYNKRWHNYYPAQRTRLYDQLLQRPIKGNRYHHGHHFILDVF